jgi:DinB family
MKLTEFLLAELDREVERSRHALEQAPEGKYDWKPHEKSMIFGYLANMVATMPTWIAMEINRDELDVAPAVKSESSSDRVSSAEGSKMGQKGMDTSDEWLKALDQAAAAARSALEKTTEEHLMTSWRLLARGQVVMESPRYEMIQDTINHWAHHRGQMTVYLRLMGAKVPALYGPSADDNQFR